jgi:hypothetical protein
MPAFSATNSIYSYGLTDSPAGARTQEEPQQAFKPTQSVRTPGNRNACASSLFHSQLVRDHGHRTCKFGNQYYLQRHKDTSTRSTIFAQLRCTTHSWPPKSHLQLLSHQHRHAKCPTQRKVLHAPALPQHRGNSLQYR